MSSSWGCPHEVDGKCARVNNEPCVPGMKGCVLFGRFVWADESKNRPPKKTDGESSSSDNATPAAENIPCKKADDTP